MVPGAAWTSAQMLLSPFRGIKLGERLEVLGPSSRATPTAQVRLMLEMESSRRTTGTGSPLMSYRQAPFLPNRSPYRIPGGHLQIAYGLWVSPGHRAVVRQRVHRPKSFLAWPSRRPQPGQLPPWSHPNVPGGTSGSGRAAALSPLTVTRLSRSGLQGTTRGDSATQLLPHLPKCYSFYY